MAVTVTVAVTVDITVVVTVAAPVAVTVTITVAAAFTVTGTVTVALERGVPRRVSGPPRCSRRGRGKRRGCCCGGGVGDSISISTIVPIQGPVRRQRWHRERAASIKPATPTHNLLDYVQT